jgi:hypothetical protein
MHYQDYIIYTYMYYPYTYTRVHYLGCMHTYTHNEFSGRIVIQFTATLGSRHMKKWCYITGCGRVSCTSRSVIDDFLQPGSSISSVQYNAIMPSLYSHALSSKYEYTCTTPVLLCNAKPALNAHY